MIDIEQYRERRLKPQIDYYDKKSIQNQKRFYLFSVIDLTLTALVPVASLSSHNGVAALLGAGILTITDRHMEQFNTLLLQYYNTGSSADLKEFLYQHTIQGIEMQ
ncbi:DUF4231 domain-containing protein [Butyricicoccus sp.]|uniref:DUF4231 domain-containing protein n=1 Tax=Butyricicoccus sp. TaxID=2049021 RepID=UPI003D7CFC64